MTPLIDTSGTVVRRGDRRGDHQGRAGRVAAPLDQRPAAVYLARLAVGARAYQAVDNNKVQAYWQVGERIVRADLTHKEHADTASGDSIGM